MTHTCACGQPVADATICTRCTADLQLALIAAITIAGDLELAITRQTRFADPVRGGASVLPFDERASEAAWVLRNTLSGWVRVMAGMPLRGSESHGRMTGYPDDTIESMAMWLLRHMGAVRNHEAAAEAVSEITAAVRHARRTIDRPPGRIYAGPCAQCGRHLYARPGKPTVTCHEHEPPWVADVADRREWMLGQMADHLSHAAEAAHLLTTMGVRVSTVQVTRWVQAGRLVAKGTDRNRRATYRLGDVTALAFTMRRTA